jgi:hypothetical protein
MGGITSLVSEKTCKLLFIRSIKRVLSVSLGVSMLLLFAKFTTSEHSQVVARPVKRYNKRYEIA